MERGNKNRKSIQKSMDEYIEKLNSGYNFVDYFLTIGLEPEISKNPWLYETSIQELNSTYKKYLSPKIINKFPSFEKKLIGLDEMIIQHIFPLGYNLIESLNESPKEQYFSIILDNNMYSIKHPYKFVSCLLFYEPLINYYKIFEKYNEGICDMNNSKFNVSTYLDNNTTNTKLFCLNDNMSSISSNTIGVSINNNNSIKPIMKNSNMRLSDLSQKETNISSIINSINNNGSNIKIKNYEKYYVPKCICLISLYPFFIEFKKILGEIYEYSKQENVEIPLEKIINNLILEVPVPPRGIYSIEYNILNQNLILYNSKINELFYTNFEFEILFMKFNIQQILNIFLYLMLGIKALFFSRNIQYLTPSILSSLILLYPFKFPFPIVSVLPQECYNFIENIRPEILGINEKYSPEFFKLNDITISDNLLVVDIDEQKIITLGPNNDDSKSEYKIPSLPKKLSDELSKKLKNYLTQYSRNLQEGKIESNDIFQKTIRNYFFEFQTYLLKDYPKYLNSNIYKNPQEELFNKNKFLKTIDSNDLEFYKNFIDSQMFIDYISKRMTPNDKKEMTDVLFFEEKIFELKGQKEKIKFLNSNAFNYIRKYKVPKIKNNLNENILEFYRNEQNQKKLLFDGIIINNNNYANNNSLSFNYILFPKLKNDLFFNNEIKSYFFDISLYKELKLINTELISKSHLNRVESPINEITNYIYLLWLKVWVNSFHYHDKKEHKYRYLQMMKIFRKINQHEMSLLSHLLKALIKSNASEDLIYHLYNTFIKSNLSPSLEIFNTVKSMVKKNIKNSGLPSSADISKFLENYTKIKLNKEDLNIKNFRERTMKNIYDIYTLTEKITFVMNEICNNCKKNINLKEFVKNLNDTNNDTFWSKCPFCKSSYLPKIKIIFGSEINKNNKLKTNTSLVDEVVLISPKTIQLTILDYSNIDIDKYKLNFNQIFWNLICYFKISNLPYDFILPYTENIFRPKKNKNKQNFFKINFADKYIANTNINTNINKINNSNTNQIKVQKLENINKLEQNKEIKISNNINDFNNNINNNNHYNTIVHKINNKNNIQTISPNINTKMHLSNKIIKLNPGINNNINANPNININNKTLYQTLSPIVTQQKIMKIPTSYPIRHQSSNTAIYNYTQKAKNILIPINNYNNNINLSQTQIPKIINVPPLTNSYAYNINYRPNNLKRINYTNYPAYNNNSMIYNTVNNLNNLSIVKNTVNNNNISYILNPTQSIIVQKPIHIIPYMQIINYNK